MRFEENMNTAIRQLNQLVEYRREMAEAANLEGSFSVGDFVESLVTIAYKAPGQTGMARWILEQMSKGGEQPLLIITSSDFMSKHRSEVRALGDGLVESRRDVKVVHGMPFYTDAVQRNYQMLLESRDGPFTVIVESATTVHSELIKTLQKALTRIIRKDATHIRKYELILVG